MFEKMAAGMTTIEPVPMLLLPFLVKAMGAHAIPARAKNIDFQLVDDGNDKDLAVNMDPIKLTVVFRNLFSNAIKFSQKDGEVEVRVKREASLAGQEFVTVSVRDTGAGLSKENLGKLFQEGMQFNANKLQAGGGSGLGLYITKGIVNQHEGSLIWAESAGEGKGCTFFVKTPTLKLGSSQKIALVEEVEAEGAAEASRGARMRSKSELNSHAMSQCDSELAAPPGKFVPSISSRMPSILGAEGIEGHIDQIAERCAVASGADDVDDDASEGALDDFKPRILVVDDSAMNRRVLCRLLEQAGYDTVQASDGLAAVAAISRVGVVRFRSQLASTLPLYLG